LAAYTVEKWGAIREKTDTNR